jgi:carbamoyltransferase
MQDGRVLQYLQLERVTRRKHDNEMHVHLERLIEEGMIPLQGPFDLIFVNSFAGNSFISASGRIRFEQTPRRALTTELVPGYCWIQSQRIANDQISAFSIDHELAHVFSNLPFHGDFRDNALLVHLDGGASISNFSAYHYRDRNLTPLECHWQLAEPCSFYNDNALSFALVNHVPAEHLAVPGKLMGLATMGTPRADIADWLRANGFFKEIWQDKSPFLDKARAEFGWRGELGNTRDTFLQDVAAAFQQIFEDAWLDYLTRLQERVRADYLYFAGGCALNIVANTRIVDGGLFQDVFIPPCPGDSGLALGAAAYNTWRAGASARRHSPYLNNALLPPAPADYPAELVTETARRIAEGAVVGLCNGPGESGPRALGNRSIVARPDSAAIARRVSMECKGREWYRPIAPVMLEKHARRLTGRPEIHHLSRYMLLDYLIPEAHRPEIVGVVHANGTSRIQTVYAREDNPFLWDLLTCLDEVHQIPALINTSFNHRGEPIVHGPDQALKSARNMGLDAVVINYRLQSLGPDA